MDWVFSDCLALVAAVSSLMKSESAVDRKPCNPAVRYDGGGEDCGISRSREAVRGAVAAIYHAV